MLNDIRPALRAFLLADSAISTVVGGARIYPVKLQQGITATSIVYNLVSEITDHHMFGPSGLTMMRMQIDAWSTTQDNASFLALLIKDRIDGWRGPWTYGSPANVINIQGVFADAARFDYDQDASLHRVSRDYEIHFEER